ncbi:T9SS type A sorting domain-containing protein [Polaribacter sp. PL03]|uniref:T9SS type A sorting domain-containing protein n=1 Tax=Polaribacter sp. PL03 TaxID=3088353 RepID=UPI0029CE580C|nr:T9SS type A sorting domain-containing protein [Polaribacter sp. PL03]MDX6747400.1 T9SS type A sorting domain-containing protein [Polaribacter sp. PL03]
MYFFSLLFLNINFSFSQTGPGGVGNTSNNGLWLKANTFSNFGNVSTWTDVSGNGNNAAQLESTQQPISMSTSALNGMPIVRFDGSNDQMAVADADILDGTSGITYFTVIRPNNINASPRGILGKRISSGTTSNYSYTWFFWQGSRAMYLDLETQNNRFNTATTFTNATNYILSFTFDGSLVTSQRSKIYNEMSLIKVASESSTSIGNSNRPLAIGALNVDYGTYLGADYAEIIHFNYTVTEVERIIINNYLSAKYNIPLSSKNFYDEDTSVGNFDFNVAGIGQATDGSSHLDSQGTGIVRINTPSALSNDDYLFWGEDVKNASYTFSSSSASGYLERLDTKWRVSKRNNLGTVNVEVKETDINFNSSEGCNALKLIVSNSSNFATKTSYDFVLSGGVYTATGVNFSDNDYFTLEYVDTIVVDNAQFYNGSGSVSVPDITNGCYKLLVKNTANGTLTLTQDAFVREIEIEAGGVLSTSSNIKLQVANGIKNNGELRLVEGSQLIQTHSSSVNLNSGSGRLYVDQIASTSTFYQSGYWSSPVRSSGTGAGAPFSIDNILKDGTVATAATPTLGEAKDVSFITGHDGSKVTTPIEISTRWLAKFNNALDWTRFVSPTASIFTPGEGWNMKSVGARFTFLGIPNDGNYSFTIDQNNYSLIGNPYPSALDAEAFILDNSSSFNGVIYIYNGMSDDTHVRGDYSGTYNTIVSGVSVGGTRYLPIGQAFFVTREAAGSGTITFSNSQRIMVNLSETGSLVAKNTEEKKQDESLSVLKLGFQFNLSETVKRNREVAITFRGLSDKFDKGYDAQMWGLQPTDLYLKVEDLDFPFIITGIESFNNSIKVPLVVQVDQEKEVVFLIEEKININTPVYLFDASLGTYHNLDVESKTLKLLSGKYTDRFFITFSNKTLEVPTINEDEKSIRVFKRKEGELVVDNSANLYIKSIKVYNLLGAEILNYTINANILEKNIDVRNIAKSVYILSIKTEKGVVNQKIIID